MNLELFTVIAGQESLDRWDAELKQLRGNDDHDLCRAQEMQSRQGREGVEITPSLYGWYVRHDSGLKNFSILASSRCGQLDGTRADAIKFAKEWVARDPDHRYAWIRKDEASMDERWPYGHPKAVAQ